MFRLRTFGGLSLEQDASPLDAIGAQRKALALLAVLATARDSGIGRDKLLALFWSESDTERARGALKQTLHVLRGHLGGDAVLGTAELRLNRAVVESDVAAFLDAADQKDVEAVVRQYSGPFLEAVHLDAAPEFEHWLDAQRADLERKVAGALDRLAHTATQAGDHQSAVTWWRRLQGLDPLNGRVALALIEALAAAGDRAGALRHAQVHSTLLREELDSPPDPEVVSLAERLRSAPPPVATTRTDPRSIPDTVALTRPAEPARPRRWRGALAPALVLAGLAAIMIVAMTNRRARGALHAERVAVAVFVNRTGEPALEPTGSMAADWVTRGLAGTGLVDVVDVGTVYAQGRNPSGEAVEPRLLARRNGAGLVVAGSYYRSGDSLYFSATLNDVATGRVVRAIQPVGGSARQPLIAVEELRKRVASALATELDPRIVGLPVREAEPPTYEAYKEFVVGQDIYWRGDFASAIPYFRRAFQLDTSFILAANFVGVAAVGIAQCELADSVFRTLSPRMARLEPGQRLHILTTQARCDTDWNEVLRLNRERAERNPRSTVAQWSVAANARRAHKPAEALAVLRTLDPEHDLGWLPDRTKVFYWREVAAGHHVLGQYTLELELAKRLERTGAARLASAYLAGRALAAQGRDDELLRAVEGVETSAPDPALVSGEIARTGRANLLATPGWVLQQLATESFAHGRPAIARRLAERAAAWFAARPAPLPPEHAFVHAQALALLGRFTESAAILRALMVQDSSSIDYRGELGLVAALQNDRRTAAEIDGSLAERRVRYPPGLPVLYRARIAAALGDRARALALLRGLPHGVHPIDPLFFHSDPAFLKLHGQDTFEAIIRPRG